jgi:phospholipase/carboxylesterase
VSSRSTELAGLRTVVVESSKAAQLAVVMLHGYAMVPEALVPFATSIAVPARFYFPEGPVSAKPVGRAWWAMDLEARARALATGPRDLFGEHPAGVAAARRRLVGFLAEVQQQSNGLPIVLVGFSQGGMLACDAFLRERLPVAALALLSSSCISANEWEPLRHRLERLPMLISHGRHDADLAFSAGEALREFAERGGAQVTWIPFDEAHEIPLVVWRALKKFLMQVARADSSA